MWIIYAALSALFAGVTAILAKSGIKETNSTLATALRTIVVLLLSWLMVFIVGSQHTLSTLTLRTWVFLIFSGVATGASWLCYFKALQLGEVNKVAVVDKSSIILTLVFAFVFLDEQMTGLKFGAIALIAVGTWLMIQKQPVQNKAIQKSWIIYAGLSSVFASLTTILGKVGIDGVESNMGTAIRTTVVLIMSWLMVFLTQKDVQLKRTNKRELLFILLSGLATGASWLFYYRALQDGQTSAVVAIDKLSIVVTVIFAYLVFKEKLTVKALFGLLLIVGGTFFMVFG
ncbi:EamA family transporter [Enterococcus sp. BWR-S5]|nr:EamA family transporter [Enterococcus sp. BWR-S5]